MTDKPGFTKEQLIERCESQIEYAQAIIDLYPNDVGAAESKRVAEIALAALTAEPMGWMDELTDNPAVLVAIPQRLIPEGKNNG